MAGSSMVTRVRRSGGSHRARREGPVCLALAALVLVSAFAVIHSTHACRERYTALRELESSQWHLQEDYGRLLLEQSTWASHYRVEKVARGELGMRPPGIGQVRVMVK
jgi:cell division protein FtsL